MREWVERKQKQPTHVGCFEHAMMFFFFIVFRSLRVTHWLKSTQKHSFFWLVSRFVHIRFAVLGLLDVVITSVANILALSFTHVVVAVSEYTTYNNPLTCTNCGGFSMVKQSKRTILPLACHATVCTHTLSPGDQRMCMCVYSSHPPPKKRDRLCAFLLGLLCKHSIVWSNSPEESQPNLVE